MKKTHSFIRSVSGILCALCAGIALLFLFSGCGGETEPKPEQTVGILTPETTAEELQIVTPEPTELPYIEFSFGHVDRGTEDLRLFSVTENDLKLLKELPALKSIDARACENGEILAAFSETVSYPVLWSVRLGDSFVPSDTENVVSPSSVHSTEEVHRALGYLPNAKTVDVRDNLFSNEQIKKLISEWPDLSFRYKVNIYGERIDCEASELTLNAEKIRNWAALKEEFEMFTQLKHVTVEGVISPDQAARLLSSAGDIETSYTVSFRRTEIMSDVETVDFSYLEPSDFDEIAKVLKNLPKIQKINLMTEKGTSNFKLEDADRLQNLKEGLRVNFKMEAFGVSFSLADEVVSFNDIDLKKNLDEVKALLPYLRKVERVEMMNCGIDNETMAKLRDEFPKPKVVWSVVISGYRPIPTDVIMIKLSAAGGRTLTDRQITPLKYCRELKYVDLGHNKLHKLDFVKDLPNLEVLIMYDPVTSLKGIEACKKLEYFECFSCMIKDLSPLAECTELRHLNLSNNLITDITPLYGLTNLERLWISRNKIPESQIKEFLKHVPNCVVNITAHNPTGEGWRVDHNQPDGYAPRYSLLRKQFLYDETEHRYIRFFEEYVIRQPAADEAEQ